MPRYEERFIPIRVSEIVSLLCSEEIPEEEQRKKFLKFSPLLEEVIHREYHEMEEEIEDFYFPFNPSTDLKTLEEYDNEELRENKEKFLKKIRKILERGNFNLVNDQELEYAFQEDSDIAVKVEVDMDEFKELHIFKRGEESKTIEVPRFSFLPGFLKNLFKRKRELDFYGMIVMVIESKKDYKPSEIQFQSGEEKDEDLEKIYLKVFRNIPKPDLEMVFPNSKAQMTLFDKLRIVLPLMFGVGVVFTKILSESGGISMILVASIIAALAGYAFKSYISYKNRVLKYTKKLSQGRYFRSLGDSAAVLQYVVNEAEEEEAKEALLGYFFLLKNESGLTISELDQEVEDWFEEHGLSIDFEIEDSIRKLEELELAYQENENWKVKNLDEALKKLNQIDDSYYEYG